MKRQIILVIMVLFLMGLVGCAMGNTETDAAGPGEAAATDLPDPDVATPAVTEQNGDAVVRGDADGLVEVRIEGGNAELTFNLAQWDKLHGIYDIYDALEHTDPALLREGPYEINFYSDAGCKDVCIATIPSLNAAFYEFSTVTVIFLMEDGTVEHLSVFPYPDEKNDYTTYGFLPWVKDIASLSYEPEDEGIGDMTIYAIDKEGRRYDVRDFWHLSYIFDGEWVYETGIVHDGDIHCLTFKFNEDNTLSMRSELRYIGDANALFTGKYTVSGSFAGGKPVMLLELWNEFDLDMPDPNLTRPPDLTGEYFFSSDGEFFTLYLADGDALHYAEDGTPVLTYPFEKEWASDDSNGGGYNGGYDEAEYGTADYTADELIDFLLEHVEKAREMVQDLGMAALVTGETEEFTDAGVCRLVILGTNHDGQFVREIYYAISPYYSIYEQDPVYGNWLLVYDI